MNKTLALGLLMVGLSVGNVFADKGSIIYKIKGDGSISKTETLNVDEFNKQKESLRNTINSLNEQITSIQNRLNEVIAELTAQKTEVEQELLKIESPTIEE